jgi:hypothetical protein
MSRRRPASTFAVHVTALLFAVALAGAWQQDVRYDIRVRLDTRKHFLSGTERLWYRNNSPDTLRFVWIHLYPNAYRDRNTEFGRELERMKDYKFSFAPVEDRGYIEIRELAVGGRNGELAHPRYEIRETEMKVELPLALSPGDTAAFDVGFDVKIPAFFSRLGHAGKQYVISQWYPKMVVYDPRPPGDAMGTPLRVVSPCSVPSPPNNGAKGEWHPDGYHAIGEFYGEFGTYDVTITLPAEMVVGATGDLAGVRVAGRGAWAADSEFAWMKLDPRKRAKLPKDSMKTLLFHAENVHDFCWVADPSFILLQDSFVESSSEQDRDELGTPLRVVSPPAARPVTINVLVRGGHEKDWKDAPLWARKTLEHFSAGYGPYPYRQLTVADANLAAGGGMEYPNIVVISSADVPGTRMLEMVVEHEIGHQWFYGMLGSNEMAEAWLDEGINSFAEMRYFEENYGPTGNMSKYPGWLSSLPAFDDRYYQKFIYYVTATNNLLKPVLTPAFEFVDEPAAYAGVEYQEAARIVDMLRRLVGDSVFDRVMQTYYQRFRFHHPTSRDFIAVAEEVSGQGLDWFFNQWLTLTGVCDYAIGRVDRKPGIVSVRIRQEGTVKMPIEVAAFFADGSRQTATLDWSAESLAVSFRSSALLKQVVLDPAEKLLETNRWNNYSPRKIEVKPIFELPSFDAYQVFYGPYLWYDASHGLQIGGWLQGREFLDFGPLHGRHMWTTSATYSTNLRELVLGASYATPLSAVSDRLKFNLSGSYSRIAENGKVGLAYTLGRVLGPPSASFRLGYSYNNLKDRVGRDTTSFSDGDTIPDWVRAKSGKLEYSMGYSHVSRHLKGDERLYLALAHPVLGSDSGYQKASIEWRSTVRFTKDLRLGVRLFAGFTGGSPPAQEQFFLSGNLTASDVEPITWSYAKTPFATQENWHIDGDANLRGYITEHEKDKLAGALNFSLPFGPIVPFFDIGNVGGSLRDFGPDRLRMDAGIRLKYGPLYADFPVWASRPQSGSSLAFRWALGLSLSGISIGF